MSQKVIVMLIVSHQITKY